MSAIAVVQGYQSVSQVRQARIGLAVYFAILIPLSLLWYILDQTHILNDHYALIMSTPAVSAILARLILREGIKDVSFQFGGKRGLTAVVFVVLFPLLLALLTYVPFWLFGWTQLNTKGLIFSGLSSQPVLDLILNALIFTVIGTLALIPAGIVTALVMAVIAIILYRVRPLTQPLLAPSQPIEDGGSQQQIAPGYLIVGLMLILAGVLDLLLNGYFITITCVLAGVGFLVYSFSKHKNSWKQRARWQQVLLIILLAVTAASFLTDLIFTPLSFLCAEERVSRGIVTKLKRRTQ